MASDFLSKWNFPMCFGSVDCKYVKITPPSGTGSTFFNYKGDFSIILLAAVDASLKFIYVDIGTNGRISDGGVRAKSKLRAAVTNESLNTPPPGIFEHSSTFLSGMNVEVPYVLVAYEAFPLNHNLMKPYPGTNLHKEKIIFNYRLS